MVKLLALSWSPQARILFRPAAVFRELKGESTEKSGQHGGWWRGPVGLVVALGCCVSAAVSGRFSIRLIVDGALSFAFVPLLGMVALWVTERRRARRLPFRSAVELFFLGYGPWLVWILAVAAVSIAVPSRKLVPWVLPLELSLVVVLFWSLYIDFHFFREVQQRSTAGALGDLALHRLISWIGFVAYFVGLGAWSVVAPLFEQWLG
jgi:hypothetical protein